MEALNKITTELVESKQSSNGQMTPLTAQSVKSVEQSPERVRQLRYLIQQSFDTFNIYGKEPEALANILSSFNLALDDCETADINFAFNFWLKQREDMPKPAQIRKICIEQAKHRQEMEQRPRYKITTTKSKTSAVPWDGLSWNEIREQGYLPEVEKHLQDLTATSGKERAHQYLNYLQTGPINQK